MPAVINPSATEAAVTAVAVVAVEYETKPNIVAPRPVKTEIILISSLKIILYLLDTIRLYPSVENRCKFHFQRLDH